jgi:isoleucyl-tRNA synthetase
VSRHKRFLPRPLSLSLSSSNDVDIWILAATFGLVQFVHQERAAYRLYTVLPRLVGCIEALTNWYVRLNRDRLKGTVGEEDALLGLSVWYEVLMTMTILMAPFTPFFAEYLYQHLRKVSVHYRNLDPSVASDVLGKADSVHFLMLPAVDAARVNPVAESRFQTLQLAVSLARLGRERRKIRNNLPLRRVIVVAAKAEDVDALSYLSSYFQEEINAWKVTLSTDTSLCTLKTFPEFKVLGARCGGRMKEVQRAISALSLSQEQLLSFLRDQVITLCGFEFTTTDIVLKRQFNGGDSKVFEATHCL